MSLCQKKKTTIHTSNSLCIVFPSYSFYQNSILVLSFARVYVLLFYLLRKPLNSLSILILRQKGVWLSFSSQVLMKAFWRAVELTWNSSAHAWSSCELHTKHSSATAATQEGSVNGKTVTVITSITGRSNNIIRVIIIIIAVVVVVVVKITT